MQTPEEGKIVSHSGKEKNKNKGDRSNLGVSMPELLDTERRDRDKDR